MYPRDLVFQSRRFSRIISTTKGSGTPRGPSMNLLHIRQLGEDGLVPQRHVVDTVVNQSAQGVLNGLFLAASLAPHSDENPSIFSGERTFGPEPAGRVPESLPLSGEVSESSGDAEEEPVVGGEDLWRDYWVVCFWDGAHFQ